MCYALQDVLKLYLFALTLQIILFIPYAVRAAHFHESGRDVIYRLLDCILQAAPTGLPALRMFIASVNIIRLDRKDIKLTFAEALRLVSVATVACFDKTGTLTGSTVLYLLLPCQHACMLTAAFFLPVAPACVRVKQVHPLSCFSINARSSCGLCRTVCHWLSPPQGHSDSALQRQHLIQYGCLDDCPHAWCLPCIHLQVIVHALTNFAVCADAWCT